MKKTVFIFLTCLCLFTANYMSAVPVELETQVINPIDPIPLQPVPHKSPIVPPIVDLTDGVLIFINGNTCTYTLKLIDELGSEVYTTFIPSGVDSVVLPSNLCGTYELRLYTGGNYYFYAEIEL